MATVLIVDSDRRFVAHMRRGLESGGLRVVSAANVNEALQLMRDHAPDAVVTEVMLDYVLAGWDLVRTIRSDPALCHVPIIVATSLTGAPGGEVGEDGSPLTVSAWLTKPVTSGEVMERLELLLPSAGAAVR